MNVMDARQLIAVTGLAIALSGCAARGDAPRMASANSCPSGTMMVCSGLYEAERELAPSCACTEFRRR